MGEGSALTPEMPEIAKAQALLAALGTPESTRCVELREPWPRDENAGEDGHASKRLDERDRLAESRPGEARRGDDLQEDDERRESRRQPAERDGKQPLPSRMADPGHDDERRVPCSEARQDCRLGHESDDEENGRCDQRRFGSSRGRRRIPRRLHGKEVEAVEDPSRDAEEVADRSGRLELEALRQQRRAAEQAQAEANEDLRFQALADRGASRTARPRSARSSRRKWRWRRSCA